jgi:hypothetical protein
MTITQLVVLCVVTNILSGIGFSLLLKWIRQHGR